MFIGFSLALYLWLVRYKNFIGTFIFLAALYQFGYSIPNHDKMIKKLDIKISDIEMMMANQRDCFIRYKFSEQARNMDLNTSEILSHMPLKQLERDKLFDTLNKSARGGMIGGLSYAYEAVTGRSPAPNFERWAKMSDSDLKSELNKLWTVDFPKAYNNLKDERTQLIGQRQIFQNKRWDAQKSAVISQVLALVVLNLI